MMKNQLKLLVVMTAMTLVGCSGGTVSATSDQTQSTSTDHTSMVSRVKEFFKGESSKFIIEMPAPSLIIEASKDWLSTRNLEVYPNNKVSDNSCFNSNEVNDILGYSHQPNSTPKAAIGRLVENNPNLKHWLNFNPEEICAHTFIRDSSLPQSGWYSDIEHGDFARSVFTSAYIANGMQTIIISKLSSSVWKSNLEAKEKIQNVISEMVQNGQYHALVAEAYQQADDMVLKDMTGKHSAPVHFTISDYDVAGSGLGTVMLKNGSDWFGNGYISGKKYTLSMESVEMASMKKDKIINSGNSTSSEQQVGDSTAVGN